MSIQFTCRCVFFCILYTCLPFAELCYYVDHVFFSLRSFFSFFSWCVFCGCIICITLLHPFLDFLLSSYFISMALPSLRDIVSICESEETAVVYLIRCDTIELYRECPYCNGNISRKNIKQQRCTSSACRKTISIFDQTMFGMNSRSVECHNILLLAYLWLNKTFYSYSSNRYVALKFAAKYQLTSV